MLYIVLCYIVVIVILCCCMVWPGLVIPGEVFLIDGLIVLLVLSWMGFGGFRFFFWGGAWLGGGVVGLWFVMVSITGASS